LTIEATGKTSPDAAPASLRQPSALRSVASVRLAYFVDTHNRFETVSRGLEAIGAVDALLVGGDITSGGSASEAGLAIEMWKPLVPRLLAVSGNWDSPAIDARLAELEVALDARGAVLGAGVGVCGVSGSPISAVNAPYELEEDEILLRLERGFAEIRSCGVHIICPHTPPIDSACDRMFSGAHIGSRAVRSFVEARQPELVLCGHVHEARGFDEIGKTRIVNPGSARDGHYAVVEIEGGEVEVRLDPG
jgi:Icc-related predicted phosphoesterase